MFTYLIGAIKLPPNSKNGEDDSKEKVKGSWRGTHTIHSVTCTDLLSVAGWLELKIFKRAAPFSVFNSPQPKPLQKRNCF